MKRAPSRDQPQECNCRPHRAVDAMTRRHRTQHASASPDFRRNPLRVPDPPHPNRRTMITIDIALTDYEVLRMCEALQTLAASYQHHGKTQEFQELNGDVYGFLEQVAAYESAREGQANEARADMKFTLDQVAVAALCRTLDIALPHERQKTHLPAEKKARRVAALDALAHKFAKTAAALSAFERSRADRDLMPDTGQERQVALDAIERGRDDRGSPGESSPRSWSY